MAMSEDLMTNFEIVHWIKNNDEKNIKDDYDVEVDDYDFGDRFDRDFGGSDDFGF